MVISDKEAKFIAELLKMASQEFGNHGCNDLPDNLRDYFNKTESDQLNRSYHMWNGDPEEYRANRPLEPYDFMWMDYFAAKLRGEVK